MKGIKPYISKITGLEIKELGNTKGAVQRLPLFIRESYIFSSAEFHDHQVVFVQPKEEDITPRPLQKHIPKIESAFGCPAILVFDEITYYLKEQLAKARISFIVPGKQLFIPFMFMDLSKQQKIRMTRTETFSPSTQCVFLYHLWVDSLEGSNFKDIADNFGYAPRTIGRCAEEMENAGLCKISGSRSKYLEFNLTKKETWNLAIDYLVSPVKEVKWLFIEPEDMSHFKVAGMSALSKYSNISSGRTKIYAMGINAYRNLKNRGEVTDTLYNETDMQLQLWSYDPSVLSENENIDPLSLYLSLKDNPEERVQIELENLLEEVLK